MKYQPAVAMWYYPLLAREASLGGNKENPTNFMQENWLCCLEAIK